MYDGCIVGMFLGMISCPYSGVMMWYGLLVARWLVWLNRGDNGGIDGLLTCGIENVLAGATDIGMEVGVIVITKIRIEIEVEMRMETRTKMPKLIYGSVGYYVKVDATNGSYHGDNAWSLMKTWVDYLVFETFMVSNFRYVIDWLNYIVFNSLLDPSSVHCLLCLFYRGSSSMDSIFESCYLYLVALSKDEWINMMELGISWDGWLDCSSFLGYLVLMNSIIF